MPDIPTVTSANFHRYFDAVPTPVALLDAQFRFVVLNEAFEHRLGARGADLIGADGLKAFEAANSDGPVFISEALASGEAQSAELRCRIKAIGAQPADAEVRIAAIEDTGNRQYLLIIKESAPPPSAIVASQVPFSREEMFRLLIEQSPVPISIQDAQFRFVLVNPAYCVLVGYAAEELIGRDPIGLLHPPEMARALDQQRASLVTADLARLPRFSHLRELVHRSGRRIPYRLELGYSRGVDGSTLWCATLIDLTVLHDTLQELDAQTNLTALANKKFQAFAALVDDAMVVIDPLHNRVLHANLATQRVLALAALVEPNSPADGLWSRMPAVEAERVRAAVAAGTTGHSGLTVSVIRDGGDVRSVRLRLFSNSTRSRELFMLAEDVTETQIVEQRRRNEEIEQRDALIREVHHRIKNNLQGVAGLLEQAAYRQPAIKSDLDGVATQIRSIATVHGMQVASGNVLEIVSLAQGIAESVFRRFGCPISVSADTRLSEQSWGVIEHDAVPVALTLNELLTNASKHQRDVGPIQLLIYPEGSATVMRVSNRGMLPAGFDFLSGAGLPGGLRLIKALIPRAGCQIQIGSHDGRVVAELRLTAPTLAPIRSDNSLACG